MLSSKRLQYRQCEGTRFVAAITCVTKRTRLTWHGVSVEHRLVYAEHCAACSNQTQTARVYPNADSSLRKHEDLTQFVSMLAQRRWRWSNIETALGQILVFAGLHTGVCLHPPLPSIIFSPADLGTFSKTAGQSQAYYNTWNWERGTYDVNHLHILTCEIAVSRASSVGLVA